LSSTWGKLEMSTPLISRAETGNTAVGSDETISASSTSSWTGAGDTAALSTVAVTAAADCSCVTTREQPATPETANAPVKRKTASFLKMCITFTTITSMKWKNLRQSAEISVQ